MTLEDISVLFGDPVELSFEQAMKGEGEGDKMGGEHVVEMMEKPQVRSEHVEGV